MISIRPLAGTEGAALAVSLAALEPWRSLGFTVAGLEAYLRRDDPALRRVVAERAGAVAGVLALRAPWLRGPTIELLAVLPEAQGGGVGRALVEWAVANAGGAANLWACVSAFNAPARAFWARTGFVEAATLPDLIRPGFDEILLRRQL